jgi:hypothetical protein
MSTSQYEDAPSAPASPEGFEIGSIYLRIALAVAVLLVASGLASYPVFVSSRLLPVDLLAAGALLALLPPLLWRGHLAWLTPFLLGAEYIVAETTGRVGAYSVVVYAAGLIAVCELLLWSIELPASARIGVIVIGRRLLSLTTLTLAALGLAAVALLATYTRLSSAFEATALGAIAAVVLLSLPYLLLHWHGRSG